MFKTENSDGEEGNENENNHGIGNWVDLENGSDGVEESKVESDREKKPIYPILQNIEVNKKSRNGGVQASSPEPNPQFQSDFSNRTLGICKN